MGKPKKKSKKPKDSSKALTEPSAEESLLNGSGEMTPEAPTPKRRKPRHPKKDPNHVPMEVENPTPEPSQIFNGESKAEDVESTSGELYPVLGGEDFEAPAKILSVKPKWIQNSTEISGDLKSDTTAIVEDHASSLLNADLSAKLDAQGIHHWFPVQRLVVPELLRDIGVPRPTPPRDICICAPTGSGKTLCYVIPIVQALQTRPMGRTRALVMLPVQDLAAQVYKVFSDYTEDSDIHIALLIGQKDVHAERELLKRRTPHVVIATPGRLLDHLWARTDLLAGAPRQPHSELMEKEGILDLSYLRYLVIDEADRMLMDCRLQWLSEVENAVFGMDKHDRTAFRARPGFMSYANLSAQRIPLQRILLSATLSEDPEQLQQWNLFQPRMYAVSGEGDATAMQDCNVKLPDELTQQYLVCESSYKPLVLFLMLQNKPEWQKILVFAGDREAGGRLTSLLDVLIKAKKDTKSFGICAELSARVFRRKREVILKKFNSGEIRTLICSDLVARGLDLSSVDAVISYSMPKFNRTYVHRVGRTARAGKNGTALSLVTKDELVQLQKLLSAIGQWDKIKSISIDDNDMQELRTPYKAALKELKNIVQDEKSRKLFKKNKHTKKTAKAGFKKKSIK